MAKILIIDDDEQIRAMLRQMLEREEHEVKNASNGNEGIKLYREDPVDLVITDLIMPEKEGIETIMELKEDYPNVKILAISGGGFLGHKTYLMNAKKLGALSTMSKPLNHKELLETVDKLLRK